MDEQLRKKLKKRLGDGIVVPACSGVIVSSCDFDEYKQSKALGGFIHNMPICLHVEGSSGAGQYTETINRYLSVEEAKLLKDLLQYQIDRISSLEQTGD